MAHRFSSNRVTFILMFHYTDIFILSNSEASDPSHSILSKDHFGLILNEPAGKIATIVVENTVNLIVQVVDMN